MLPSLASLRPRPVESFTTYRPSELVLFSMSILRGVDGSSEKVDLTLFSVLTGFSTAFSSTVVDILKRRRSLRGTAGESTLTRRMLSEKI